MAAKSKFHVPTVEEIDNAELNISCQPMTLFKNYKDLKTKGPAADVVDSVLTDRKPNDLDQKSEAEVKGDRKRKADSGKEFSQKPTEKGKEPKLKTQDLIAPQANVGNDKIEELKPESNNSGQPILGTKIPSSSSSKEKDKLPTHDELEAVALKAGKTNCIIVNPRQRGNPILKHVRNVPWEYGSIVPDYVMGMSNCALYLSLRYHQLNPTYIHNRMKELGKAYDLRVLLVQVDVKDPHHLLKELAKICILADFTLMLAFSIEEAGRYLETYKVYENKPAEAIMEKTDGDYISKLIDSLTTVKSVNKTDCMTLLSTFGSVQGMVAASKEDLSLCPGFGPQKAQRLFDVFHEPFLKSNKRKVYKDEEPQPSTSKEDR
ncbi:hypothetical protein CHS0354_039441 [Potamilus streckersoni]|uniref:DNA excision repair protein ERCC-1 n=1 Tax=Potamilus streckersoni TaxID=2493646 RepID=A0AAE0VMR5_9BIVA|nr:hypothetical protein CHS0354_039441 [Potamilus streckersoni]